MKLLMTRRERLVISDLIMGLKLKGDAGAFIRMTFGIRGALALDGPIAVVRGAVPSPGIVDDVAHVVELNEDQAKFLLQDVLSTITTGDQALVVGDLREQLAALPVVRPIPDDAPALDAASEQWTISLVGLDAAVVAILKTATALRVTDERILQKLGEVVELRRAAAERAPA